MIQREALDRAVQVAELAQQQAATFEADPQWLRGMAMLAESWIMIHDRVPATEELSLDLPPVESQQWQPPAPEGDEKQVIEMCGHRMTALLHAGQWLHVPAMDECDDPPIAGRRSTDG